MARSAREGPKGKSAGQAIAITTLSPVRPEALKELRKGLRIVRYAPGFGRPLAKLAFIYFGRWTVVDALPPAREGDPWQRLRSSYLLFESNYDGSWVDYLDAFADRIPGRIARMWASCFAFQETVSDVPGRDGRPFRPAPFKDYVARNELEVLHFHSAYPDDTTRTVRQAIALADRLERDGQDETSVALAVGPVPERRGGLVRTREFLAGWWRMVTGRYGILPLTAASPIEPGREEAVRRRLLGLEGPSPLARVPGTHMARLVYMPPGLTALGQEAPDELDHAYLLFTSNHDGSPEAYLRGIATGMGDAADAVWGACAGYPGTADPDAFARWLGGHRIATRYFVVGFPPRRVEAVQAAVEARRALAARLTGAAARPRALAEGARSADLEPRVAHKARPPADIDPAELQGNVLSSYGTGYRFGWYGLLRAGPGAGDVLRRWSEHITFGRGSAAPRFGDSHLNLAFTRAGLEALGAPTEWLDPLPEDFTQGAAARSPGLGDRAESAREQWEFGREPAHVLVAIHSPGEQARDAAVARLKAELAGALELVHEQEAGLFDHPDGHPSAGADVTCADEFSREHFGFADGCSQPSIEGWHSDHAGNGVLATRFPRSFPAEVLETLGLRKPARRWRGVAPGEFVLGCADEDGAVAPGSDSPLCEHGTFMVYRKLQQDVETFREHTRSDAVRARIVGRWQDGTPLALSPGRPDTAIALDRRRANDFDYGEDPDGLGCPLGAHVRRTNPRDDLPAGGEATMRHRMIRRGMPYGTPYADAPEDPDRGLMFICYGASISRGFEAVQRQWCDTGFPFGLGDQPDYLLQQRPAPGEDLIGSLQIGPEDFLAPPPKPFVIVRGTEYLLLPGRSALRRLVEAT